VGLASDLLSAVSAAVSSQISHGKAAEITVDPSSQHGHQGDDTGFVLNQDNARFELFRSSHNTTFIYGKNDFAGTTVAANRRSTTLALAHICSSVRSPHRSRSTALSMTPVPSWI